MKIKNAISIFACLVVASAVPLPAQQKGQWVPGQFGLNAGVIPDPGITYANLALNYSASRLNDSSGNKILQNVTGTYSFWVDQNIVYYVPHHKILGGYFMPIFRSTSPLVPWWLPSLHFYPGRGDPGL